MKYEPNLTLKERIIRISNLKQDPRRNELRAIGLTIKSFPIEKFLDNRGHPEWVRSYHYLQSRFVSNDKLEKALEEAKTELKILNNGGQVDHSFFFYQLSDLKLK